MEMHCLYVASKNFSQIRMCETVRNATESFSIQLKNGDNGEKTQVTA